MLELFVGFSISLFAGMIGSMTGIGGGIIISPFLSYLSYTPSQISATSLISIFSTSLSSSYIYSKKKLVEGKVGLILAISSIPGTFIGVYITGILSIEQFRYYFAIVLLGTAGYLIIRSKYLNRSKEIFSYSILRRRPMYSFKIFVLVIISFFAGILSSSFGIGGGVIFVPCMIILLGFQMNKAAATSQLALLFTSVSGLILFIYHGKPEYFMGLVLSIGSVIGSLLGTRLATSIDSIILLKIFSMVLIIVSIKLFWDAFNQT